MPVGLRSALLEPSIGGIAIDSIRWCVYEGTSAGFFSEGGTLMASIRPCMSAVDCKGSHEAMASLLFSAVSVPDFRSGRRSGSQCLQDIACSEAIFIILSSKSLPYIR